MQEFVINRWNEKIIQLTKEVEEILEKYEKEESLKKIQNLNLNKDDKIKIVFIGQYSAGKSTIIAALTGNKDIKIDADISTDEVTEYEWNKTVLLVDTPGINAEKVEHTEKAYNAIKEADIVIYCITSDLFSQDSLRDFINLAYEKNYKKKMFLVVNKMGQEDGEFDDKCNTYNKSIDEILEENNKDPRAVKKVFFDALDYKDGKKDDDDEFIRESHFEDFIEQLNNYIKRNNLYVKLDTPIKYLINVIDESLEYSQDDSEIKLERERCDRIEKNIADNIEKLRKDCSCINNRKVEEIKNYAEIIINSRMAGNSVSDEEIHAKLENFTEELNYELNEVIQSTHKEIENEWNRIESSELEKFVINSQGKEKIIHTPKDPREPLDLGGSLSKATGILREASNKIVEKGTTKTSLFKTELSEMIKSVGTKMGKKFRPFESIKIANKITKFAKAFERVEKIGFVVGPTIELAGEIRDAHKEKKKNKQLRYEIENFAEELRKENELELSKGLSDYMLIKEKINKEMERLQIQSDSERDFCDDILKVKTKIRKLENELLEPIL